MRFYGFARTVTVCAGLCFGPVLTIGDARTIERDTWKTVTDKQAMFHIEFPTAPKYVEKNIESGAGQLIHHTYTLEEGPISFVVTWLELPPEYVRRAGEVRILNGAKEAFFKRFKGKFHLEKIIQLGAAQGRDATFETEDEVWFRVRIYLRSNRLVQTVVMAEPDLVEHEDVKRFTESLKWD